MPPDPKTGPRVRDREALERYRLEHLYEPCEVCEQRPGAHVHHKRFRSQGGSDVEENFAWLCHACHSAAHGIEVVL